MYVKLRVHLGDRLPGDVVNLPASVARDLLYHKKAVGGEINARAAKAINLDATPSQKPSITDPVQPEKEVIFPKAHKPMDGTVRELKEWLDSRKIPYRTRANKTELLQLIREQ